MITEEQVGRAASRYRRWNNGDLPNPYMSPYFNCDGDDPAYINRDRLILADAYIAELARRDAERAERAKPIDAEWLESIGCVVVTDNHDIFEHSEIPGVFILDSSGILSWRQEVYDLGEFATRGQLLDLRAALKGGA